MNERGRNESDISRYTDVEYSPEGYKTVYRWGDFLEIAGGHVYNAMDTIDLVSTGGEYEGFNPRYAYTCEFVGCSTLVDGIALFRPVSRDGEDLTQIAFLRSDIDDDTGAYTECFEAGSFDIAAASDIQCSDLGIDLLDYFRGRSFEGLSGVKRGLNGREAPELGSRGAAIDNRDAKRKRPITCLESGVTYDSAYRAAKELGFADSRNIFRSIQRGTCTQGLHFYYADEPKPAPEFFKPAKVKGGKSPAAIAAAAKVAAGNSAPGTDYREHGIQRDRRAVQ